MRAYYVNLAKRTERRALMEGRFSALGIEFERIEATTPADLTPAQRNRYSNPSAFRWQSEGELACSLSHAAAMRKFLATDAGFAAIFEDDAILSPSLGRFLDAYEQGRHGVDILRLETDNGPLRILPHEQGRLEGFAMFRLFNAGGGAAGYVMSRKGAERVLAGEELLFNLTDQALFNPYAPISRSLVVRQLVPALIIQEDRLGDPGQRMVSSDLESLRMTRDRTNGRNFWRRSIYNFYDFVQRDIYGAARNFWLKQARGVAKRDIPFKAD